MPLTSTWACVVLAAVVMVAVFVAAGDVPSAEATQDQIVVHVRPGGPGTGDGTRSSPYTSLAAARDALRGRLATMRSDAIVNLEDGTYSLSRPFTLTAADSGRHGHRVIYQAAPGAHPVISGGYRVRGWRNLNSSKGIWVASVPRWLHTRQLYVNGSRAQVAQGQPPVTLTQNATGYTASSPVMASWSNPSEIEFVYPSGPSNWTETRCRVANISGTAVTMDQPCWDNSTLRPTPGTALEISGFGQQLTTPPIVTNAFPLLTKPGQWYLDERKHRVSYIPLAGQDMRHATVIAPHLETLVQGAGTANAPIHDLEFRGITFSYATWLEPSTNNGYSDFQAGVTLTGANAYRLQGACDTVEASCPYGAWTQTPGNVAFHHARDVVFDGDTFEHLGAAGLALGDGSRRALVRGCRFTDISGSGLTIGGVDQPLAQGGELTSQVQAVNNYFHDVAAEYRDSAAVFVGYAQYTSLMHNQIDDVPYSGISIGWGGWLERFESLGPLSNYSRGNVIKDNLIFDHMKALVDGGGIYANGIQGSSMSNALLIQGNVVLDQHHPSWAIYTDNGAQFVQVRDNVVFDVMYVPLAPTYLPGVATSFSFGGCGGGPIEYSGNYSLQADPSAGLISANPACGGHPLEGVTVTSNTVIGSLDEVPASLLANAGLESPYEAKLRPRPAPSSLPAYNEYP